MPVLLFLQLSFALWPVYPILFSVLRVAVIIAGLTVPLFNSIFGEKEILVLWGVAFAVLVRGLPVGAEDLDQAVAVAVGAHADHVVQAPGSR